MLPLMHRVGEIRTDRNALPEISSQQALFRSSVVSTLGNCIVRSQARRSPLAELTGIGVSLHAIKVAMKEETYPHLWLLEILQTPVVASTLQREYIPNACSRPQPKNHAGIRIVRESAP